MTPKNRSNKLENAITLTTYEELERFASAFATGCFNLLIIVGERGLQKSTTVRNALPRDVCWVQGSASPFVIYQRLFQHLNQPVVIDDVDKLYRSKDGINLLKFLCDTEPVKKVSWQSATRQLEKEEVPREFKTTSRVTIISNDWQTLNRNVAAVEDLGHTLLFSPTAHEVHERTRDWFDDTEIFEWIGANLHRIENPSMRLYYKARELKQAGFDWKRYTPLAPENAAGQLATELLASDEFETQEQRVREFIDRGGGCRATFFNHLKRIRGTARQ